VYIVHHKFLYVRFNILNFGKNGVSFLFHTVGAEDAVAHDVPKKLYSPGNVALLAINVEASLLPGSLCIQVCAFVFHLQLKVQP